MGKTPGAKPFQIVTQASLGYGHSSDVIKSLVVHGLYEYHFMGTLFFPHFHENVFLVITFELKQLG